MKFSIYNSTIYINGKHTLFYNSFSGKFIIVKNILINLNELSLSGLCKNNKILYSQFVDAGFILEDYINEEALLRNRIYTADNNENEYILHINPTLDCNFRCWYCYEKHIPNSKMSSETLNSTLKYISSILNRPSIKSFELGFFGGEPLFYFDSIGKKIITHTHAICKDLNKSLHIHFTSNGALINETIVRFLSEFCCGFQITLDGGKIAHDKTRFNKDKSGSFDTIINNIFLLVKYGIDVIVRVNYTSKNVETIHTIYEYFKHIKESQKRFIKFDFQRVWQDRTLRFDETESKIYDIRQQFKTANFLVLANYIPHDIRNSCYGDKLNHTLINYNGDIFGCTARDFTEANRIGFLDSFGNIHYDSMIVDKRNHSKLSKAICKKCRIAPICGGGCKQRAFESIDSEKCTFNYTDEDINNIIMDIFEYSFINTPQ